MEFEGDLNFDFDRLSTLHFGSEKEFTKREKEQLSLKAKIAQERYQDLFQEVKIIASTYGKTVEILTKKNNELEAEVKKLKEKCDDDGSYDEVDVLRKKNAELERTVRNNLATISELRKENGKLGDEKRGVEILLESLNTKFRGMHERVARLEDDTEVLMSVNASEGEPAADPLVAASEDKDEEDVGDCEFRNDTVEDLPSSLQCKSIKQKSAPIDFEAPKRHGYKGGPSVLKEDDDTNQDCSWSSGKETHVDKEIEETYEARKKTREVLSLGEQLPTVLTRNEKRKRELGQASRGQNYVEEKGC